MFSLTVSEGVCRIERPGARWLSTGYDGGRPVTAPAAYNCTVPNGWSRTDLDAYVAERLAAAGFDADRTGPALLTGVEQRHGRRARLGPVEVVATAGVSNPAALPVADEAVGDGVAEAPTNGERGGDTDADTHHAGTVNVVVGTTRDLAPGALANLLTVAAEAKAATLCSLVGVPGTTTDAVIAACDPAGEFARFSGSATAVGGAARVCVRDAVAASLAAAGGSAADAETGVVSDDHAAVAPLTGPLKDAPHRSRE